MSEGISWAFFLTENFAMLLSKDLAVFVSVLPYIVDKVWDVSGF